MHRVLFALDYGKIRKKRENPGSSFDPHLYTDSIGIPGEVLSKVRIQIEEGFEFFLFWWSTMNNNVDLDSFYLLLKDWCMTFMHLGMPRH